jgi:hypothetical protein
VESTSLTEKSTLHRRMVCKPGQQILFHLPQSQSLGIKQPKWFCRKFAGFCTNSGHSENYTFDQAGIQEFEYLLGETKSPKPLGPMCD